jgi:hypothetical protein
MPHLQKYDCMQQQQQQQQARRDLGLSALNMGRDATLEEE